MPFTAYQPGGQQNSNGSDFSVYKPGQSPAPIPAQKKTFLQSLFSKKVSPDSDQPSQFGTGDDNIKNAIGSLKTLFGGSKDSIANKLKTDIQDGASDIQKGMEKGNLDAGIKPSPTINKGSIVPTENTSGAQDIAKGVFKAGARVAGDTAGAIFAPAGAAIEATGAGDAIEHAADTVTKKIDGITDNPAVQEFALKHPNAGEDFNRLLNLLFAGGEKGEIDPTRMASEVKTGAVKTADFLQKAPGQVVDAVKTGIDEIKAQRLEKAASQMDDLVGKITQGKTSTDIARAKKELGSIDIADVKTAADFKGAIEDKISAISTKLDERLATDKTAHLLNDLSTDIKVGDETIQHNYVKDSIDQLKQHFEATNDQTGLAKIAQLELKAKKEGLTIQDINNLAKLHGQELNAFNANGQAASGLTKQAAENTRTGLKKTARSLFKDKAFEAADEQVSNLIRMKKLVGDVEIKVQDMKNRIQKRNFGQKAGRVIGQVLNTLSFNSLKGFVEYLVPRGQGLKLENALDWEKKLQSRLKKAQAILNNKTLSEAETTKKLEELAQESLSSTQKNTAGTASVKTQASPTSTQSAKNIETNVPIDTGIPDSGKKSSKDMFGK